MLWYTLFIPLPPVSSVKQGSSLLNNRSSWSYTPLPPDLTYSVGTHSYSLTSDSSLPLRVLNLSKGEVEKWYKNLLWTLAFSLFEYKKVQWSHLKVETEEDLSLSILCKEWRNLLLNSLKQSSSLAQNPSNLFSSSSSSEDDAPDWRWGQRTGFPFPTPRSNLTHFSLIHAQSNKGQKRVESGQDVKEKYINLLFSRGLGQEKRSGSLPSPRLLIADLRSKEFARRRTLLNPLKRTQARA